MTRDNQNTLRDIAERLESVENGKNYGPLAEVDALFSVAEDLHQLSQYILADKLQLLAEEIIKKCPSVKLVCDAQGADFILHVDGSEIPSRNYPAYHSLKEQWSNLFPSYPGTYISRKGKA